MSIQNHDLEERERFVRNAKAASFLDAAFLIFFYNNEKKRWGRPPRPTNIEPDEVFSELNPQQYEEALKRVQKLWSHGGAVGAAYWKYPGAKHTYHDELLHFKTNNPDFCEESYSMVVNVALREMR